MPRFTLQSLLALCLSFFGSVAGATPDGLTYFHIDNVGSPIAATDTYGNVTWRENYLPHGEKRAFELSGGDNQQWFAGHFHDDDTKLTYMGARHYDPVLGRFLSVDPAGFNANDPFTFNRYAYSNNNTYRFTDPTGEIVVVEAINGGKTYDFVQAQQYLAKVDRHRQNILTLLTSKNKYTIQIDPKSANDYYQHQDRTIVWSTFGTLLDDGSIQSSALGLAHEVEHAVEDERNHDTYLKNIVVESGGVTQTPQTSATDLGSMVSFFKKTNEERRVMPIETDIARKLGEPIRQEHSEGTRTPVKHPTYHRGPQ